MPLFIDPRGRSNFGIGICDRCSRKFPLDELFSDPNSPGLKVCIEDLDDFDPYRLPARMTEDITLPFTRPDVPFILEEDGSIIIAPQVITGLSPNSAEVGSGAFTLVVSGTGFTEDSVILWDADARVTTFISPIELHVEILATDIEEVGIVDVAIADGNSLPFEVTNIPEATEIFTASGTFTVPAFITSVNVLVVAGGGSGHPGSNGGGGGAGGLVYQTDVVVVPEAGVPVVIGAGGDSAANGGSGENGENSSFGAIIAVGGGVGRGEDGGSGGGGRPASGQNIGGSGTAGQGRDGGDAAGGGGIAVGGGGGGGAGEEGETPLSGDDEKAGDGGDGIDFSGLFGTGVGDDGWFAGGGAGAKASGSAPDASGGKGGGGEPGASSGQSNTGGGGGAGSLVASGGSGIVIVRYGGTGENPVPAITEIDPDIIGEGSSEFTLTVRGGVFVSDSVVRWNGVDRATTFVNITELQATIPATDVENVGVAEVTVFNPAPGGGVSNVEEFTIAVADPFYDNVSSLLHFDGPDASTTFTDEKGVIWTPNGNAQLDTAQKKFGTASGLFDGSGDFLSAGDGVNWELGSGDFTLETWVRFNVLGSTHMRIASKLNSSGNQREWMLARSGTSPDFNLFFSYTTDGTLATQAFATFVGSGLVTGQWYHLAAVRSGPTMWLYLDGIQGPAHNVGAATIFSGSAPRRIATAGEGGSPSNFFNGWLDDFRLTKGVARYTENFTPPTAPFPNRGPEV